MKNQAEARPAIMPSITASGVESTSEVSPAVNPLTKTGMQRLRPGHIIAVSVIKSAGKAAWKPHCRRSPSRPLSAQPITAEAHQEN